MHRAKVGSSRRVYISSELVRHLAVAGKGKGAIFSTESTCTCVKNHFKPLFPSKIFSKYMC